MNPAGRGGGRPARAPSGAALLVFQLLEQRLELVGHRLVHDVAEHAAQPALEPVGDLLAGVCSSRFRRVAWLDFLAHDHGWTRTGAPAPRGAWNSHVEPERPTIEKVPSRKEPFYPLAHTTTAIIGARNAALIKNRKECPMALAHAIAEHLPYLRRYARALCGTQTSGDAYVRACLETIVADPAVVGSDTTPRVALYRLFHKLWGSANLDLRAAGGSRPQPAAAGVERKLGELTPARRQALLLTAMEGFNVTDTARILAVGEEEVKQMVAQAVREISDQPRTKVLIIEDEPIVWHELASNLRHMRSTVR